MALQWMMIGITATAEAVLALLLTISYPAILRKRIVDLVSSLLQPMFGIIPFALFQLVDIHWKNEHRLKCSGEVCTVLERDRYERSLFKAQRNALLCVGACVLYWVIYQICKYYRDIQKLEDEVKRMKTQ